MFTHLKKKDVHTSKLKMNTHHEEKMSTHQKRSSQVDHRATNLKKEIIFYHRKTF